MNDSEQIPSKTSKINAAVDQIYRFGEIWRAAYKHRLQKDYHSWNLDLDTAWSELAGDLKQKYPNKEDYNNVMKDMHKFTMLILKVEPLISGNLNTGFNIPNKDELLRVSQQYIWLHKKEIYLRQLQNELGKGTLWDSGDEDDID